MVAEQLAGEVAGQVVSVYWPVLTNWVDATVQRADVSQCILTVLYNDSVVEDVDITAVHVVWTEPIAQRTTHSTDLNGQAGFNWS